MIFSKNKKLSPSFKKNATITGVGATVVAVSLSPLAILPVIGLGTAALGGSAVVYGGKKIYSQFTSGEDVVQDATLSPREQKRKDREDRRTAARKAKRKSRLSK